MNHRAEQDFRLKPRRDMGIVLSIGRGANWYPSGKQVTKPETGSSRPEERDCPILQPSEWQLALR